MKKINRRFTCFVTILLISIFFIIKALLATEKTNKDEQQEVQENISQESQVNLESQKEEDDIEEAVNVYEDYSQFPFENLQYVDETGYEILKALYTEMDYKSEFDRGNTSSYEFYIEKYREFVNDKVPFYYPEKEETEYLSQYGEMTLDNPDGYDIHNYDFFFFDMDGDGNPELGVSKIFAAETRRFIYIFKYDEKRNRIIMWEELNSSYSCLIGTKSLGNYIYGTNCWFSQVDQNGETEVIVFFINDEFYSNGIPVYMVSFPQYKDASKETTILEEIKQQGYYAKSVGRYYFRVTEEQYNELFTPFIQAKEEAKENLKEVTYTYEELFGETLLQTQ